jgi:carbonic anhydrase
VTSPSEGVTGGAAALSPAEVRTAADHFRDTFSASGYGPEPQRRVAVVACMDARLDVFRVLGLHVGDAHILRNAGGLVTDDVIRSLVLSQRSLGTRVTILVHHTDCGLQKIDDATFLDEVERASGQRPPWLPGAFSDPFADVRRSLRLVRECPWLVSGDARGYVFDVHSGELVDAEVAAITESDS